MTQRILTLRGDKVMLDADLAELYGVPTRVLVQAVKRNPARFPPDLMFSLTEQETARLKRGDRRAAPYAFTEQGVAMLSSVLRSERAIQVNVEVMRAFVRSRGFIAQGDQFKVVFDAIRQLVSPPVRSRP